MSTIESQRVRLVTALLLVGTFALGSLTGAGITRWASSPGLRPPPPHGRPPFGPWLVEELGLHGEQVPAARELFERHRSELDALVRENFPKVHAANDRAEAELRALLTPEQLALLEARLKARPPRPPLGGPGGPPLGGPGGPLPGGPPLWPAPPPGAERGSPGEPGFPRPPHGEFPPSPR
jgi:hypothetical protein